MTRVDKDFYETPDAATYPIMAEAVQSGAAEYWRTVLDLGCGDGRLAAAAIGAYRFTRFADGGGRAHGIEADAGRAQQAQDNGVETYWSELSTVDWRGDIDGIPDLVISNPPFSLALEFLEYAHDVRDEVNCDVLFLLPVGYLGSQGRHAFWKAHPPHAMRVFSKRLSFTGDGKTANADYAWFYWGDGLDRGIDFYP